MPESATIEAPAAPAAAPAPAVEVGDIGPQNAAQLDAMLEKMRPMPKDITAAPPAAPVAPVTPAAPTPEQMAAAKDKAVEEADAWTEDSPKQRPAPKKEKPINPFDPPASVLGEDKPKPSELPTAPAEEDYGTMPEAPDGGFKSKKQESEYKKWRESHERLKQDFKALREQSKAKPPVDENQQAQIADLIARNAELNAIVEQTQVERHPYVRQTFDEPRRQLVSIAQKALEKVDVDPAKLSRILALDGKARVDAMDELYGEIESPTTREKVTNAISQIDVLDEKRAAFLEDRQTNIERLSQAEKAERYRQMNQQENQMSEAVDKTIDYLTNKLGFEFLRKATEPGSDEWNTRVDGDLALIRELSLKNTDPQKLLTAIALGVQAPHYRAAWQNERTARMEAEKRLGEYEGALPSLDGQGISERIGSSNGTLSKDDEEKAAAGIEDGDSLAVQSRKLAAYWTRRGG